MKLFLLALGVTFLLGCKDQTLQVEDYSEEFEVKRSPENEIVSNPDRSVFFGDLHVHTSNSFDAYLLGNTVSPSDGYRYAKGELVTNSMGVRMQLREPLDFYAVTDHGLFMGVVDEWADPTSRLGGLSGTQPFHNINEGDNLDSYSAQKRTVLFRESFGRLAAQQTGFLGKIKAFFTGNVLDATAGYDNEAHLSAWREAIEAAEQHNEPGSFTAFIGYEWTSSTPLPQSAAYHRNVIFRGSSAPQRPFTRFDDHEPEGLWTWQDKIRALGADSLAIPHNSNQSDGQVFRLNYSDGRSIDREFADLRMRNEPLVEITQVKGTSETHPRLSPRDEWANFEILNTRKGKTTQFSNPNGSYVRQALANGLALEQEGRGNPFKIGFVGASDTHNSAPSFDESNYFGSAALSGTAENRGSVPLSEARAKYLSSLPPEMQQRAGLLNEDGRSFFGRRGTQFAASGLAAVWSEENTRESLFLAMRRKETYGTSGNRIKLRFFAGFDYETLSASDENLVSKAYQGGVPMGADLVNTLAQNPRFLVWAQRDKNGAPLQRLQIIKVWYDGSYRKEIKEKVFDVACSDGLSVDPVTHRCPDNGALVNLTDCSISRDVGANELRTFWADPDFDASIDASYYVRVLENPTCRWSTWDALRAGVEPRSEVPLTIQERAWSSPIWVHSDKKA